MSQRLLIFKEIFVYNSEEEITRIPTNIVIDAADVKVNKNNFLANLPIDRVKGTRMETMMGFFLNHPIKGALLVNPEQIVHHYLCEFGILSRFLM